MKALVWGIVALLAVLWSVGIAVLASVSGWLARSADQVAGSVKDLAGLTLPPWVEVWLNPTWREALVAFAIWSQEALAWVAPWIGPLLEWVAPLLWVFWAIGMVVLVLLAAGSQFLIGRMRPARVG
ncbi:MAG: hypothetical protein KA164_06780 [Rhodoferax sp.]|jgi:hypothetical protein|nr:hypothetical protein [Rhodoferax sp.]